MGRKKEDNLGWDIFGTKKAMAILERRIDALERIERDLLNRLMANKYETYVLGKDVIAEKPPEPLVMSPDAQEENAGTTIEIDED